MINVTGLVHLRERLSYILSPVASLELLAAEYLRETNISNCIYHLLMVTYSLDALKTYLKRKDMRIKKEERRQDSKKSR